MARPVIGVVPLVDLQRESWWMLPGYMQGVEQAGGLPVMLPLTSDDAELEQLADSCDGFLLTGGQDPEPWRYGEERLAACGESSPERDEMEARLLPMLLERDKPLLGICRGHQFLNIAFGGTLWQDLPSQRPSGVDHHQTPPYDRPVHRVDIVEGSPLFELLGVRELEVNSYHHQAVKELAPGLEAMAWSEDGLAEALRLPGARFAWGLQWHPEFSYKVDEASRKIFAAFVGAAAGDGPAGDAGAGTGGPAGDGR